MFTFLNTSSLSNVDETKQMLQKGLTQDKPVAMVTNFMHSPDLPDLNFQIENSKIKTCKYPYELQIEVSNNNIYLQLIAEEKNAFAEEKSNQLFDNLDKLLKLKTFKDILETKKKNSNIHFDDFDF